MEIITTRIVQVINPTQNKLVEIYEIAKRVSAVRNDVWQRYGSLSSLPKLQYPREVRDGWIKTGYDDNFGLQARQWKMAFDESFATIKSLWSNAKRKVRKSLHNTQVLTAQEKHYAFYLLKSNQLLYRALTNQGFDIPAKFEGLDIDREKVHKYLASRLRKHKGAKPVQKRPNTFSLDAQMYDLKEDDQGRLWLGIMSLTPRERIHLLLTSPRKFTGNIRIVLHGKWIEVHYTEKEICPEPKASPEKIIGIDKGFKKVITDSNGETYGAGFGEMLRIESDRLSEKNKNRNKIYSVAKKAQSSGNISKAVDIAKNNLGRKKYNRQKWSARKRVKTYMGTAIHELLDNAQPDVIVGENLNFSNSNKKLSRKVKRHFASWLKGQLQSIITMRCQRSGAAFVPVNAAYTSQVCSWCGAFGIRSRDIFYCSNCNRVVDADYNGARNVLQRYDDPDIGLFTPREVAKCILEERFRTGETVHPGPEILVYPGANDQLCTALST